MRLGLGVGVRRIGQSATPAVGPTASFTWEADGLSVDFTDTSTPGDAAISGWSWDFGDESSPSMQQNPTHVYDESGEYTVTLTVTDGNALEDEAQDTVEVEEPLSFIQLALSLSPAVGYDFDEATGQALDLTGNGRHGNYELTHTKAVAESCVPSTPAALSVRFNQGRVVCTSNAAWANPGANFTMIVAWIPRSFASSRDIIGKPGSIQIWQETSRRLQFHISPQWTSFLSSNDDAGKTVLDTPCLIGVRQNATTGKASGWLNGVKVAEVNKSTTLDNGNAFSIGDTAGRLAIANAGGAFYWPGVALTDQQMADLYAAWAGS